MTSQTFSQAVNSGLPDQYVQNILDTLPDFVLVVDLATMTLEYANHDMLSALGYAAEYADDGAKPITEQWLNLVHPDDQAFIASSESFRRLFARKKSATRNIRFKGSDGSWYHFSTRSRYVGATDNEGDKAVIVAHDVSSTVAARDKLLRQERGYRLWAENISDIIIKMDLELNLEYVSPSIETALGWNPETLKADDLPEEYRRVLQGFKATVENELAQVDLASIPEEVLSVRKSELMLPCVTKGQIPFEVEFSLIREDGPDITGILLVARDVRERKELDHELQMAAKVFESNADGILILDSEGLICQVNPSMLMITGYLAEDLLGRPPTEFLVEYENEEHIGDVYRKAIDTGTWRGERLATRKSGDTFYAMYSVTVLFDDKKELDSTIITLRDITDSKVHEERIQNLAYYDALTGLPNRTLFLDRLGQELQRCERHQHYAALLFLDLDQFKAINDSLGHALGDELLKQASERLQENIRSEDTVGRMSGDEFTIILAGQRIKEHVVSAASNVAQKIMTRLAEPFVLEGNEVFISVSIGVAIYADDGEDSSTLLRSADTAMYFAKQAGKNNFQYYTEEMNAHCVEQLAFQNNLYKAVADDEFEVFYQPQYSLSNSRAPVVESLLRWRRPDGKIVTPQMFMQLAEQTGLIIRIGEWLIKRSMQQFAEWRELNVPVERIAINLSARQFADSALVDMLSGLLKEYEIPAECIELELKESVLMADIKMTRTLLDKLKNLGVRIVIDDFGTGCSSLHYLKELPIDMLKIDGSFVANVMACEEDKQIVNVIVGLAKGFGLEVVAEGVETQEQADYLESIGCTGLQGYLYREPQPAYALEQLLIEGANGADTPNLKLA